MIWFYISGTLLLTFFLLKNIHSTGEYKKYSKQALFVFDDTTKLHKASKIFFIICFFIALIMLLVSFFFLKVREPDTLMINICLIIGCFLFGFFPFTPGRWVLAKEGIYVYNYNIFIPWGQMIGNQIIARKRKTFLMLSLKQLDGEHLKRTMYPLLIPSHQATDVSHMIRDFINLLEKKKYRKQLNEERSVALKDRKFY